MKKKIVSVCLVVCLLATAIIGTTLAYFTDTAEVTNTFTVGNVDITLDEAKVGGDGQAIEPEERVISNEYKLYPGKSYDKDPTVHVSGESEDCYVFVEVAVSENIESVLDEFALDTKWAKLKGTEGSVSGIYYYVNEGNSIVSKGTDLIVFDGFKILDGATNEDLAKVTGADTITVIAYAIQAEGFTTAQEAWDAYTEQNTPVVP